MKILNIISFIFLTLILAGCSENSNYKTGFLRGMVSDAATMFTISNVQVVIFNANSNAPVGATHKTDIDGWYNVELSPGRYYATFSKLGYDNIPPEGISPLSLNVYAGHTTEYSVKMIASNVTGGGSISGRATLDGHGFGGILVTAGDTAKGYSSVSDGEGYFVINNIPAGSYKVQGWYSGFESTDTTVTVSKGTETNNLKIILTLNGGGRVTGKITFLATTNIEVDVALVHPLTRQTIPGLSVMTVSQEYNIPNVPSGRYLARATYANDTKVVDPDWIIKNGEPFVTVNHDTVVMDFSVTGAVELLSPTNASTSTQPVVISDSLPMFTWAPYSSADNYVIEVINQSGRVIWGGFSDNWSVRNIVTTNTQIRFNSDTSATERLKSGMIYRWKIYASKEDHREPYGWKLISTSEDQVGIIKFGK
jgi:Carboxypeptidase regulatory-like domain